MKRITYIIMMTALLFSMSACGRSESPSTPAQQNASGAVPAQNEQAERNEVVIVDNDKAIFKITNINDEGKWGYEFSCYLENKADKTVHFAFDEFSVNGFMIDPMWGETLPSGKKTNSLFYVFTEALERNGIDRIEEIEFRLLIMPEISENYYDLPNAYLNEVYSVSLDGVNGN